MAISGGALIGVSSVLLLWFNGRIAGISGITNGMFTTSWTDAGWRTAFIVGLIVGGFSYQWFTGESLIDRTDYPVLLTVAAGLLVGFGTRLGSGCTSGHGICGISRLSGRSMVATVFFIVFGMVTATSLVRVMS